MKNNYLMQITHKNGAIMEICAQTDRADKQIYIKYCGVDIGYKFTTLGHAARLLEKTAAHWGDDTIKEYRAPQTIKLYGCSEHNKRLFLYDYNLLGGSLL